jgi:hypothetical protein
MSGDLLVFGDDTYVEKNQIYNALFEQSPYDDIVQTYLEILLPSLGEMSARLFKPHLPRGELSELDSKLKGTPKPSCFANNKKMIWLKSKSEEERGKLIAKASKDVKTVRKKFKSRLTEITENRREAVQLEIAKKCSSEKKQEAYTKDILTHGLWQSEVEVDNMLLSYTKIKDKIEALKAQISFRKNVLLQQADTKETFNFSKKKPQ